MPTKKTPPVTWIVLALLVCCVDGPPSAPKPAPAPTNQAAAPPPAVPEAPTREETEPEKMARLLGIPARLFASDVQAEMQKNALVAKSRKGQVVEVAGSAAEVRKVLHRYVLMLKEDFACFLTERGEAMAASIQPGQGVLVRGRWEPSPLIEGVALMDCVPTWVEPKLNEAEYTRAARSAEACILPTMLRHAEKAAGDGGLSPRFLELREASEKAVAEAKAFPQGVLPCSHPGIWVVTMCDLRLGSDTWKDLPEPGFCKMPWPQAAVAASQKTSERKTTRQNQ